MFQRNNNNIDVHADDDTNTNPVVNSVPHGAENYDAEDYNNHDVIIVVDNKDSAANENENGFAGQAIRKSSIV